jgi:hypothetical protein
MNPLELLAERSAGGFPNLAEARRVTKQRLEEMRAALSSVECDTRASIVLFGSWGRQELTSQSDDDWTVLVDREADSVRPLTVEVGKLIGTGDRRPGAQGIFADAIACDDLVECIGLEEDDNNNLTRRLLLLLESVAVLNESAHCHCRRRVLEGYLDDSVKDFRPPRFLLNDVIRYWRTICVDFVGKERRGTGEKWALRNLKLGLSRKALFAGGLLPVLSCHRFAANDIGSFLDDAFETPSIDRIAKSFLDLGAVDAGVRAVGAYDAFIGLLNDTAVRGELESLSRDEAMESEVFKHGKRLVKDFQQGLLALLFETPLEPMVREYGIF